MTDIELLLFILIPTIGSLIICLPTIVALIMFPFIELFNFIKRVFKRGGV